MSKKKQGILNGVVNRAFDNYYSTFDLHQFAIDMAHAGDVRYQWQADIVYSAIAERKQKDGK